MDAVLAIMNRLDAVFICRLLACSFRRVIQKVLMNAFLLRQVLLTRHTSGKTSVMHRSTAPCGRLWGLSGRTQRLRARVGNCKGRTNLLQPTLTRQLSDTTLLHHTLVVVGALPTGYGQNARSTQPAGHRRRRL